MTMTLTDHALLAVVLAALNLGVWSTVAWVSTLDWRHYHDDRAARGVLLALVLVSASAGGLASALGFANLAQGLDPGIFPVLTSVARGAMIVGGLAYLADLHHRKWRSRG